MKKNSAKHFWEDYGRDIVDFIIKAIDEFTEHPLLNIAMVILGAIALLACAIIMLWKTKIGKPLLLIILCSILVIPIILTHRQYRMAAEWQELNGTDLTQLEIIETHSDIINNLVDCNDIFFRPAFDSLGNTYESSYFELCSYKDAYAKTEAYTDIATNGEYMYLEGTIFCRQGQNPDFTISFRVYADGELVYDSGDMKRDTPPKQFKVCINNAKVVRIQSSSNDFTLMETNPGIILVNARLRK